MNLNEYQEQAARTADPTNPQRLTIAALGLAGESGELIEMIKKHVGHGHDLDRDAVADELGDVLWYVAELASALGIELDDAADRNLTKLRWRYPDGFSSAASKARVDVGQSSKACAKRARLWIASCHLPEGSLVLHRERGMCHFEWTNPDKNEWRFVGGPSPALAWAALIHELGFDPTAPPELV